MIQIDNYITASNLSEAWLEVFRRVTKPGVKKLTPLVVIITDVKNGQAAEDYKVREELDAALKQAGECSCQTVASTIFPNSLWNKNQGRERFFERYRRILPEIKKCPPNRNGVYSERLIAFRMKKGEEPINQLNHIIQTYQQGNHRHSALQASIFNPYSDHTDQRRRGFPCLQQVAFEADHKSRGLIITGFYAKQYIFEKAYGNYLGLCGLGAFMAHEMGLELKQVTCITSVAERGDISKRDAQDLLARCLSYK